MIRGPQLLAFAGALVVTALCGMHDAPLWVNVAGVAAVGAGTIVLAIWQLDRRQ